MNALVVFHPSAHYIARIELFYENSTKLLTSSESFFYRQPPKSTYLDSTLFTQRDFSNLDRRGKISTLAPA